MGARIQIAPAHALVHEVLVVPGDEAPLPVAALIEERRLIRVRTRRSHARGRVGHRSRLGQQLLHPGVRGEGLALLDADGREESAQLGIEHLDRLAIDDGVEFFEEMVVIGMYGVEFLLGAADELHRRRIRRLGEGIDFQAFLPHLGGCVRLAVNEESAQGDPVHPAG